jgi:glyoxylase-like metal-dependent hydrolase (beta-lactamase superfamily II)
MTQEIRRLLPDLTVFERGWLSANNMLFTSPRGTALVDSGYCTHAPQTLALVQAALHGQPLDVLVNTHLHSDHCGGNAALQSHYPALQTFIPPGHAAEVARWDSYALSYDLTGQQCPRFGFNDTLQPGGTVALGARMWQVHGAPGHDTHSVVLFEPESRVLISADALWESGFGVVFPELDGEDAFGEVAATLDLIDALQPQIVIPGHGRVFGDVPRALAVARRRLEGFVANPRKHALYAAKALLKFKLLELQKLRYTEFAAWAQATPCFEALRLLHSPQSAPAQWIGELTADLQRVGAARRDAQWLYNAEA